METQTPVSTLFLSLQKYFFVSDYSALNLLLLYRETVCVFTHLAVSACWWSLQTWGSSQEVSRKHRSPWSPPGQSWQRHIQKEIFQNRKKRGNGTILTSACVCRPDDINTERESLVESEMERGRFYWCFFYIPPHGQALAYLDDLLIAHMPDHCLSSSGSWGTTSCSKVSSCHQSGPGPSAVERSPCFNRQCCCICFDYLFFILHNLVLMYLFIYSLTFCFPYFIF